jgi:hypothetical protein
MDNKETYWSKPSVRDGNCPTHGSVHATKMVPKPHFPYIAFGIRKLAGLFQPYRCPACGAQTSTS